MAGRNGTAVAESTQPTTELLLVKPPVAVPQTFAEAMGAWSDDEFGGVVELETEWKMVEKETLIGVPFLIHSFTFNKSDKGARRNSFVSCHVITEDDRRLVFNDGSSGVHDQLEQIARETGRGGGILCRSGLRVSEFRFHNDPKEDIDQSVCKDGSCKFKHGEAKTFYLN